jgi:hypothetical protein
VDFLDDLAAAFFVAMNAHHLSCRTGPHGRAYLANNAGSLRQTEALVGGAKKQLLMTFNIHCAFNPASGDHHFDECNIG